MAPSAKASRRSHGSGAAFSRWLALGLVCAVALSLGWMLAGCATTMQKAAAIRHHNALILARQHAAATHAAKTHVTKAHTAMTHTAKAHTAKTHAAMTHTAKAHTAKTHAAVRQTAKRKAR